ncbi:Protein OS-9 [Rhynchospora pubera]|uniref:Protein OS-9 n=1 Tax=Rhynchospora pubera TaxID=906938 RepID=A0AAV8HXU5_9POAL|nr:Protein OS-9 [Rhynchospora pubera]
MAKSWRIASPLLLPLLITLLLVFSFVSPSLAKRKPSPRPITDTEIRERKNACYADIESGMWGPKCKSSMIDKENCALQCLSPQCYDLVYGGDPLEEGEKDYIRSQEYKYCMHKLSLGESLEGIKGAFDY